MWSIIRPVLGMAARHRGRKLLQDFHAKTCRVAEVQQAVLLDKVRRNADCRFGREHHFDEIYDVASFRRNLPVASYDFFAPYIEQVKDGETCALFGSGQRVRMFSLSSGTTGATKFIPITDQYLNEYRRAWLLWGFPACRDHPRMLDGKILSLVGDWEEFRTPSGIPCGSVSGLVASVQARVARSLYCLPDCLMKIKDVGAKYYTAMRFALAEPRISFSAAANPATLIGAARLANEQREYLVRDIADGTLSPPGHIPPLVRASLEHRIRRPNRQRARELDQIIARTGELLPKDYWPELALLGNWLGGTMGAYLGHYPRLFGDVPVRDLGLIASEGRMTIPMADGTSAGVLDITSHFYEFIPEEEIDSRNPTVLLAHELEQGRNYYILLTTSSGLYRYHISDVLRCVGFSCEAPVLEFLNKGSHCSSVAGEKLTESQVVEAVRRSLDELDMGIGEFTLTPCWDDPPYYALLMERRDLADLGQGERLAELVERHLNVLNIEYRSKRQTLRLGPVQLRLLPAYTWLEFDQERRRQTGASAEQYKHRCLVANLDFVERFATARELPSITGMTRRSGWDRVAESPSWNLLPTPEAGRSKTRPEAPITGGLRTDEVVQFDARRLRPAEQTLRSGRLQPPL